MKKKILIGALVLVAIVAVIAASTRRKSEGKGTAVTLGAIKTGDVVSLVSGPGAVNPEAIVDISAHLPGKITRLAVREGDRVEKGQLLLELDRTQYEATVQQAHASVEAQRSQVELARAQHDKAQLDLRRAEDLHRRGLSSDQDLDLARTTSRVQEANLRSTERSLDQTSAQLDRARDDLDKCRYTAPMNGVVSRLNVEEGEIAVTGTMNNAGTVLLSIADLSRMEVEAEIDETDVVDVRLGQKAHIKVDAFPDTTYAGTVTEIANTAETRNRGTSEEVTNFRVKVVLEDNVEAVRPGMSSTVEIETGRANAVPRLPIQALVSRNIEREQRALEKAQRRRGKGGREAAHAAAADSLGEDDEGGPTKEKKVDGVYVLRDGRAVFIPIRCGLADDRFMELKSGVVAGDRIVTGPYQTLRTLESGKRAHEKKEKKKDAGSKGNS